MYPPLCSTPRIPQTIRIESDKTLEISLAGGTVGGTVGEVVGAVDADVGAAVAGVVGALDAAVGAEVETTAVGI